jgi:hypothetical protein
MDESLATNHVLSRERGVDTVVCGRHRNDRQPAIDIRERAIARNRQLEFPASGRPQRIERRIHKRGERAVNVGSFSDVADSHERIGRKKHDAQDNQRHRDAASGCEEHSCPDHSAPKENDGDVDGEGYWEEKRLRDRSY